MNQAVHMVNQCRGVGMGLQGLRTHRGVEAGHDQGSSDSLPGDVPNCDPPCATAQGKEIVIIAANAMGRLVESLATQAWYRRNFLWNESLLHVSRDLQVVMEEHRIHLRLFEELQKGFDVIAEQQARFSSLTPLQRINDRLMRFHNFGKIACNLPNRRPNSYVENHGVPHPQQHIVLRGCEYR